MRERLIEVLEKYYAEDEPLHCIGAGLVDFILNNLKPDWEGEANHVEISLPHVNDPSYFIGTGNKKIKIWIEEVES